jgi:large subunit ribosomal protein L44e
MKIPKTVNRHCPFCNEHHKHKVSEAKRRGRNQKRPLSRFSGRRLRQRGERRGMGNQGRFSKPAISAFKRVGKKTSDKTDLRYTCQECRKTHVQQNSKRTTKVQIT